MYRILVVDDDPMVTRLIQISLELEDFKVEEAWDGKTALRMLKESPPDLLLLDIMMPTVDGWDIIEKVRTDADLGDLPVVMLTAKILEEDMARGWRMGADGYVVKPFNPLELAVTLREVLSATPEERKAKRDQMVAKLRDEYPEGFR